MRHLRRTGTSQRQRFMKPPYSTLRVISMDLGCCRLPADSAHRNKAETSRFNQFCSTSPSFLQATRHAEIKEVVIPRPMTVEVLSW